MYIYIERERREIEIEQCRMGKTLVNTTNFPTSFGNGRSQGVCCLYNFYNRCYIIYVIYLIHMQREEAMVKGKSTACHGLNLVLELNQKVLKFLKFFIQ